MAINIEIKAKVRDPERVAAIAQGLSGGPGTNVTATMGATVALGGGTHAGNRRL